MRPFARAALFVILMPMLASASGATGAIDGPWTGRADTDIPGAPVFEMTFKTDGTVLSGSITNGPARYTIQNGTTTDSGVVFDATQPVDGGASTVAFSCSGAIKDQTVTLMCQTAAGDQKKIVLTPLIGG